MTAAIISLLVALVPILFWWLKRKRSPTPEERQDDNRKEFERVMCEIATLRARGDNAGADALLRRMHTSTLSTFGRQRGDGDAASGDTNQLGQASSGGAGK